MEIIIQVLILFIVINCVLKLSFWKWWQAVVFGVICGAFVVLMQQYAILQSKTQLHDYLSNRQALQDMAVLITLESAICFAFCFAALMNMFGGKKKRWLQPLFWYPSLLLFPVLFYLLTQAIFTFSGTSFSMIAYVLAGVVVVFIPLGCYAFKQFIPEKELRLELHFLVSLFVAILGLLTTVNGNVTYAAVKEPINFKAILLSVLLFLCFFLIGFLWNRYKPRFMRKFRRNG